ncbi:MAG: DUF2062 domain-containing protein [Acidobacteriota bacterium]|nr:DUF2062 domain-containing protein [Acidobacteriota bacterium]
MTPEGFKHRFLHMLGSDSPPETVAASFAIGVAISFTPLLGLHWIIALLLAFILKLNKVDVLLGTLVVNPITLPPVAAVAIPIGRLLLRARREAVAHLPWHEMFRRSFWTTAGPTMKAIGLQMAVGMFFISVIAGALTYVILVNLIRRHRAKLAAAALVTASEREEAAAAEQSPPPV